MFGKPPPRYWNKACNFTLDSDQYKNAVDFIKEQKLKGAYAFTGPNCATVAREVALKAGIDLPSVKRTLNLIDHGHMALVLVQGLPLYNYTLWTNPDNAIVKFGQVDLLKIQMLKEAGARSDAECSKWGGRRFYGH